MIVKLLVAVCGVGVLLSVAVTENGNVPAAAGGPLMVPVDGSSASPGGRLPELTDQVTGATPPLDASVAE